MTACYVIFGARLTPRGEPGAALRRGVGGALAAAQHDPGSVFLVTGGEPRAGITEAAVMERLLREGGVAADRILMEDRAANTRESALRCAGMLRVRPELSPILVCSDRFHQPRCVWLLRRAGIQARAAPMPDERREMRVSTWLGYAVREAFAFANDWVQLARNPP